MSFISLFCPPSMDAKTRRMVRTEGSLPHSSDPLDEFSSGSSTPRLIAWSIQ